MPSSCTSSSISEFGVEHRPIAKSDGAVRALKEKKLLATRNRASRWVIEDCYEQWAGCRLSWSRVSFLLLARGSSQPSLPLSSIHPTPPPPVASITPPDHA